LPHHNIDAYLKSDYQKTAEVVFGNEVGAMLKNRKRSDGDVQRTMYSYVALAEKRGYLHYSSKDSSLHIQIHKKSDYEKFEKYNPMLFCMNDSEHAQDSDRVKAKEFLSKLFSGKSSFEK